MSKERVIRAVDLFCGAGGTSTGLALAAAQMEARVELTAINHSPVAIETHTLNHPEARHIPRPIELVNPHEVAPEGHLNLLVASPECTHHSNARGGKPRDDQSRASAWEILPWLQRLSVDNVIIENVPEFRSWGPLTKAGKPVKNLKGETYKAFLNVLRSLNYNVQPLILNAADYGDATTRRRLFMLARRNRRRVFVPHQSHSLNGEVRGTRPWRGAREIIDWSIPAESIFTRKRPLKPNTMKRIIEGLRRYGGPGLEPFLLQLTHGGRLGDVGNPLPTITGATRGEIALVQPFLLSQASGGAPRTVDRPVPTIPTGGAHSIVEAFVLPPEGVHRGNRPRSPEEPLQTLTSRGGGHLVAATLVPFFGERKGQAPRSHDLDQPLPTVTSHGAGGLVEGVLVQYNGTGGAHPLDRPVPTLTTRDRYGLAMPVVNGHALDIRFRMLQPHELAAAMGFPSWYRFAGNKREVVQQIGNAVAVNLSRALCLSMLEGRQVEVDYLRNPERLSSYTDMAPSPEVAA